MICKGSHLDIHYPQANAQAEREVQMVKPGCGLDWSERSSGFFHGNSSATIEISSDNDP